MKKIQKEEQLCILLADMARYGVFDLGIIMKPICILFK